MSTEPEQPLVSLRGASAAVGGRTLWSGLDLELHPGELVAVLGPNGAGKSSLIRALLGQLPLSGDVRVLGAAPGRRGARIGYVPQQKLFDRGVSVRANDLVGFGLDGNLYGPPLPRRPRSAAIAAALDAVGAGGYRRQAVGTLSGGEQQRLRIAQALVSSPRLLLADEPLLSLDLAHQRAVLDAIDGYRIREKAAVLLVTHDINPLLRMVDRVLYLAPGGHRIGPVAEVLTGDVLSELYGVHVDVLDVHGRILVVADDGEIEETHTVPVQEAHP
ncbi:metal ABC transporter ATP-binding protein [Herbiconiux sp. L3-i23]|uniref:metal ABC transporter ATP-binding protein n=1 Tax=Herbiconiux sp. L3-i23 TaxID=2905871 RepID=UPI002074AB61|nr:metal ABC transporter ATP-binding protein [Herbiconiux sp. L3-i23]